MIHLLVCCYLFRIRCEMTTENNENDDLFDTELFIEEDIIIIPTSNGDCYNLIENVKAWKYLCSKFHDDFDRRVTSLWPNYIVIDSILNDHKMWFTNS